MMLPRLRVGVLLLTFFISVSANPLMAQIFPVSAKPVATGIGVGVCADAKSKRGWFGNDISSAKKDIKAIRTIHDEFVLCARTAGLDAAFAHFLLSDGMVVSNAMGAISGEKIASLGPDALLKLRLMEWKSVSHVVAQSGDIAVTRGKWRAPLATSQANIAGHSSDDNGGDSSAANAANAGEFLSIWVTLKNASPKLLFTAMTAAQPSVPRTVLEMPSARQPTRLREGKSNDALTIAITMAEAQFGGLCSSNGMAAAFDAQASSDIGVMRQNLKTLVGKSVVVTDPGIKSERWRYMPQNSGVSNSGDLAYVFGRYSMTTSVGATERGYFARIWRVAPDLDATDFMNWKVLVDIAVPI